jgi:formate dehydrogenase subunit delta
MKSSDKLVMMANQIGTFFKSQGPDKVVSGTAEHIRKFWDPRMRASIAKYVHDGGEGLHPEVRLAVQMLARESGDSVEAASPT